MYHITSKQCCCKYTVGFCKFSCELRKTHLVRKVHNGHSRSSKLKAHMQLPISDQQQPLSCLAWFQRFCIFSAENSCPTQIPTEIWVFPCDKIANLGLHSSMTQGYFNCFRSTQPILPQYLNVTDRQQ